jgi:hypothetical protein
MQKIQNFLSLLILITLFTACDDNSNGSNNGSTPSAGSWKITYFFDKKVETGNYTGYVFDFGSNGSLTASANGQTWNGSWSTGFDDSKDKILITFSGAAPSALTELQEDWLIIKMDDNFMHFEHTSGGNGDTDVVHLERM